MSHPVCQLYLITPPVIDDLDAFAALLAGALDAGPVAALQIRLTPADDAAITTAVKRLAPIAQGRGVAVILNDRPDLAAALGCDGVHVGQTDASVASARRIMGKTAMIGATLRATAGALRRASPVGGSSMDRRSFTLTWPHAAPVPRA